MFGVKDRRASSFNHNWRYMLEYLKDNNWQFRHRSEEYNVLFTSETAVIDAILANPEWIDNLVEFAYADDQYLLEFSNHSGIDAITDIKFVKRQPEYCYQVTLGNFDWRKSETARLDIIRYLVTNRSDFLFKGREQEIIESKVKGRKSTAYGQNVHVYHGFRFYAKSADDIIMLHMMAPGKVISIIKLMERRNETITC